MSIQGVHVVRYTGILDFIHIGIPVFCLVVGAQLYNLV